MRNKTRSRTGGKTKGCITKGDLKLFSYDLSATDTRAIGMYFSIMSSSTVQGKGGKKKNKACLVRI